MSIIYSAGHSNRSLSVFLGMLRKYEIELLVDVRSLPRSRYNPHFNKDSFEVSLKEIGISYLHLPELGGFRRSTSSGGSGTASRKSGNTVEGSVKRHSSTPSFQGYIDYMETDAFRYHIERLLSLGAENRTLFMCAEADPRRCHRAFIADALICAGAEVIHLIDENTRESHRLPQGVTAEGLRIRYPLIISRDNPGGAEQLFLF
ncbi:MAG: DUF488 family protein [Vulcanimicrobiota bacterium]